MNNDFLKYADKGVEEETLRKGNTLGSWEPVSFLPNLCLLLVVINFW